MIFNSDTKKYVCDNFTKNNTTLAIELKKKFQLEVTNQQITKLKYRIKEQYFKKFNTEYKDGYKYRIELINESDIVVEKHHTNLFQSAWNMVCKALREDDSLIVKVNDLEKKFLFVSITIMTRKVFN